MADSSLWKDLQKCDPSHITRNSGALYDRKAQSYTLPYFGGEVAIYPQSEQIRISLPASVDGLFNMEEPLDILLLYYLLGVRSDLPKNDFIKPEALPGGEIYRQGAHSLSLPQVAERYDGDLPGFIERGELLGGFRVDYGDAGIRLAPLPKTVMILILWQGDDEFPPRASLLLDSGIGECLPPDICWGLASSAVQAFF
jgi:hypothetical protein